MMLSRRTKAMCHHDRWHLPGLLVWQIVPSRQGHSGGCLLRKRSASAIKNRATAHCGDGAVFI